jgi:hypothetical protein
LNYRQAVAEAKRLVKRSDDDRWRLCELTYEQVKVKGVKTRQWATDIGVSPSYVGSLIKTWKRYSDPRKRIKGQAFSSHVELAAHTEAVAAELVAEAARTGKSVKQTRYDRNKDAEFRARMEAAAEASEGFAVDEHGVIEALDDPDVVKEGTPSCPGEGDEPAPARRGPLRLRLDPQGSPEPRDAKRGVSGGRRR